MDEEDKILNEGKDIAPKENPIDDLFTDLNDIMGGKKISNKTTGATSQRFYNSDIGNSTYDEDLIPDINLDPTNYAKSIQEYRARQQPITHQFAAGALRTLPNMVMGTIEGLALGLDPNSYYESDEMVGNWLSNLMKEGKEGMRDNLPIYRENPEKALDMSDTGWWMDSLWSLTESVGSFAIGGGILSKGIGAAGRLANASKVTRLSQNLIGATGTKAAGEITGTLTHALIMNHMEGAMEAVDVQEEVYNKYVDELGEEEARKRSLEAGAATINTNRWNVLLNLTSSNLFFRNTKLTRKALKNENWRKTTGRSTIEGGQESIEEIINEIASEKGRKVGDREDFTVEDLMSTVFSREGAEAALLGFLGGMGQTILTTEGVNRFMKTGDPDNPGEKISIKEYNKKQYKKYQDYVSGLGDKAQAATVWKNNTELQEIQKTLEHKRNKLQNLQDQGKTEEAEKLSQEIEEMNSFNLGYQAFQAFERGAADRLIQTYESLAKGDQLEGWGNDYKEKGREAVETIRALEKTYNKAMKYNNGRDVYLNRAHDYGLKMQKRKLQTEATSLISDLRNSAADFLGNDDFSIDIDARGRVSHSGSVDEQTRSIQDEFKDLPEYRDYVMLSNTIKNLDNKIKKNQQKYKELTSPKKQEQVIKEQKEEQEKMQKLVEELSEQVEAKAKKENEEKLKEQTIEEQKKKEAELASKKKKDAEVTESEFEKIFNHKTVDDIITVPEALSKDHADKDAIITDINEETKEVTLSLPDGSSIIVNQDSNITEVTANNEANASSEGGSNTPVKASDHTNTNTSGSEGGARVISTAPDGSPLLNKQGEPWVEQQYPDYLAYERTPRNKKGEKVGFEINKNTGVLRAPHIEALNLWEKHKKDPSKLTTEQKEKLYNSLPLLAKFGPNRDILAPLEAATNPDNWKEGNKSMQNFNQYSKPLRKAVIDAMISGEDIDNIVTTVQDQFDGTIQTDYTNNEVAENNIMGLDSIESINDIELYMVNMHGHLINFKGETKTKNFKGLGEIYTYIPTANGRPFSLKLNVRKIQPNEAEALYKMFELRLLNGADKLTTFVELEQADQDFLMKNIGKDIELLSKIKGNKRDLTLKDITDLLIWDNTDSKKSRVKLIGAKLAYGDKEVFRSEINKDDFIKFITENKRRHIKFTSKPNDTMNLNIGVKAYKDYLINEGILNTNAVVGEPTFQGKTHIYLNQDVEVIGKEKPKPKVFTPKKGMTTEEAEAAYLTEEGKLIEAKTAELKKQGLSGPKLYKEADKAIEAERKKLQEKYFGAAKVEPVVEETPKETDEEIRKSPKKVVSSRKEEKTTEKPKTFGEGLTKKKSRRSRRRNDKPENPNNNKFCD